MKATKFFALAIAALGLVACGGHGDVEVSKVSLDKSAVTLEVGGTAQLVATVEPEGAAAVEWSCQDESVATVKDGLVTGVKEGSTIVVAKAGGKSASCLVTVGNTGGDEDVFSALLTGSDYYVIALDATSFEKIAGKVKDDFRINGAYVGSEIPAEATSVLEIWNSDLSDANWPTTSGLNCFGLNEGWIAMNAASCSWENMCGGIRQVHRTIDLTGVTPEHTFAIVYKTPASNTSSAVLTFTLYGSDGGKVEKNVNAQTNGEWTLIEWSMADLKKAGLTFDSVIDGNATAFYALGITIAGANQGVEVDCAFYYKK